MRFTLGQNLFSRTRAAGKRPPRGCRAVPVCSHHVGLRVRGMLERIGVGRPGAAFDLADLLRIAIIAAMKRSSSAFGSDSVGSTMIVPATGKLTVGAWKP